jgi:hypothetical protein
VVRHLLGEDLRKISLIWTVPGLLLVALATSLAWPSATDSGSGQKWTKISVELPVSDTQFPPGDGAEITPQCLICHSAGMVLSQPPLTQDQWISEINKMRTAFGAPLPADQVKPLARYLYRINGARAIAVDSDSMRPP